MTNKLLKILAINPGTRYTGVAVFVGTDLRDWAVKVIKGKNITDCVMGYVNQRHQCYINQETSCEQVVKSFEKNCRWNRTLRCESKNWSPRIFHRRVERKYFIRNTRQQTAFDGRSISKISVPIIRSSKRIKP